MPKNKKGNEYKNVFRFLKFLRPYRLRGTLVSIGMTFNVLLKIPLPLLTMYLIDEALINKKFDVLYIISTLLILTTIAQLGISYATNRGLIKLRQKVFIDLKSRLLGKIERLPMDFFKTHPSGYIITRITSDVNASDALLFDTITSFFLSIFQI